MRTVQSYNTFSLVLFFVLKSQLKLFLFLIFTYDKTNADLHLIITDSSGTVPPRVTDSRTALSAVQGDVVELPCAAQGFPVPRYR